MTDILSAVTELPLSCKSAAERMGRELDREEENAYDDGNIPEIDLPKDSWVDDPVPEELKTIPSRNPHR